MESKPHDIILICGYGNKFDSQNSLSQSPVNARHRVQTHGSPTLSDNSQIDVDH